MWMNWRRFCGRQTRSSRTIWSALVKKYHPDHPSPGTLVKEAGLFFATVDIHAVVATAHRSGGVCLLAHPGRGGDSNFDEAMLDQNSA